MHPHARLRTAAKAVYALGDHSVNFSLMALLLVYPFFLTDVAGLPAALAALVPLIGRIADALADPLMGRISDRTRWRAGRRRPFFLLGAVPFGLAFAALWWDASALTHVQTTLLYAALYILYSLSMTVVSVPYLAIIPEMTRSYDERTALNTWRAGGAILGALLAASALQPLAVALGDGPTGYQRAGALAGLWLIIFWPLVHRFTFERPELARTQAPAARAELGASIRALIRHRAFVRLTGLYIFGRIAIDLSSAMFLYYFSWWLGRPEDFKWTLGLFLLTVTLALPFWNAVARGRDKHVLFLLGAASWLGSQAWLFCATPEWPRAWIFAGAALGGIGYAAADMVPWSMLGEVVDEDEYETGERREGVYFGLFMFLRKLGGALAVALALFVLDFAGYEERASAQSETVRQTIRALTAVVPAVFVVLAALFARGYPLTRARHKKIRAALDARHHANAPATTGAA